MSHSSEPFRFSRVFPLLPAFTLPRTLSPGYPRFVLLVLLLSGLLSIDDVLSSDTNTKARQDSGAYVFSRVDELERYRKSHSRRSMQDNADDPGQVTVTDTIGGNREDDFEDVNASGGFSTDEEAACDGDLCEIGSVTVVKPDDEEDDTDSNSEPSFVGFEGSLKFPVKITHQPTVPVIEKIDRRRFGSPKRESNKTLSSTSSVLFDLPQSPSRDVNRKRNRDFTEEVGAGITKYSANSSREFFAERQPAGSFVIPVDDDSWEYVYSNNSARKHLFNEDELDEEVDLNEGEFKEKINVTILGLFELTQGNEPRPEGPSELQAAMLAVDRVNEKGFLTKFHLRLVHNDTQCDPGVAVDRFFHALYSAEKSDLIPLLLGTACSEVTETLAKIVPYWNIVQVSFGSTAPALSDSTEFPFFLRTVAPDSSHNPARIALIKYFGWDTVTTLSQTGDMYSLAVNDLVTELEHANITCTATITFAENDYKDQLWSLKERDTRIIIGSFSPRLAPQVFCEAWKLGMHGGDYAWILPDDTIDLSGTTGDWWRNGPEDCSPSQLSQTMDGMIIVKSHATILGDISSDSGLSKTEFATELEKKGVTVSRFSAQTYDAVWAMALALKKTEFILNQKNLSMAQYNHQKRDLAYQLLDRLRRLHFLGVSGPLSFNDADRVGITAFYQMQGYAIRRIAIFVPDDNQLIMNCHGCATIKWPGGHPPTARRVFRLRVVTVAPAAFLAVACLASVGVTLALAFLAFNFHFRKHKNIKLSSPRLNNMAAAGCVLVYGAVILLGLDHATLPDSSGYFPTICTARVYLLSAGFSMAFGSMFTKTYRVHRIFTRSRSGVVKNKLLQDTQLISLIFVLLLIDGLVVTLWVTLDPMQRHLRNLTLEISPEDRSVVYQPQVEVCRSQHTNGWLGALYAYKGLLLVVGVYMAWETRHVKIPALNDSQYIGMSVYSVVITSGIVVVLANLMSDQATLAFVTITALILASTTATLALLFLPQLANIIGDGERMDPVVSSLGLKIEFNTRRFVTDDKRELQYRVEVQNRVYHREMAQLDFELARLEKQLGQEPVDPSHASSSASLPQRNPSISGGLPLLLLSVLPPVIPRASWPSADPTGVASALRAHMGYISGLVPGAKASSTYQVDTQGTRTHLRCGSGPIISITSEEDRRFSLGLKRKESSEPRVNFNIPNQSKSQTSSREKIRGSPRFPHRIMPANSLGTITGTSLCTGIPPHRWHSMEDSWKPRITTPHSSCSPTSDVWATREVGVPLSELGNTSRGKRQPDYQMLARNLTIPVDSDISPDDVKLGNDLRKLFRENSFTKDMPSPASPVGMSGEIVPVCAERNLDQDSALSVVLHEPDNSESPMVLVLNLESPISETMEIVDYVEDEEVEEIKRNE